MSDREELELQRQSGDLTIVGALVGVAAFDADAGDDVEISLTGVWEFLKVSGQINQGAAVWWNASGQSVNAAGAGFFQIGFAVRAAGSDDATCRMRPSGITVVAAGA
jgi:predicted RecA/RadA family phage recombinase